MDRTTANRRPPLHLAALTLAIGLLAGCEEGQGPAFLQAGDKTEDTVTETAQGEVIERDVEAPEVFQVTEAGLWDGRPSLGGVWVAHPDVTDPERVMIRNTTNGKSVVGALFRREREIPGPRIQASSDAAAELGMLAGAPVELNVTALRKEVVTPEPAAEDTADLAGGAASGGEITETALDPIDGAAAAIEAAAPADPAPSAPAPKPTSSLSKPYIQIGIFSVEENADRTAGQMRNEGMEATVREQSASGKTFWRVVVGPAQTKSERSDLLAKVKQAGFSDAYAVTN
ncbi:Sporulation related domain-containing protein [Cribrihabitans marinus]|uniref:Sporulation related domain-containing protein n=1 Tax=Cribrihabitans marinus TaxID=1227549 RepID=A0A1H6U827_9RHOB|nr:SPOR domain-containing protein [Cribrihabitans marinus]GGH21225.1 sporulation protein [Cribrihabitans marinus]SEI84435.1 Sporulation related domain-containing protein [Cribrihabitans marinus]